MSTPIEKAAEEVLSAVSKLEISLSDKDVAAAIIRRVLGEEIPKKKIPAAKFVGDTRPIRAAEYNEWRRKLGLDD